MELINNIKGKFKKIVDNNSKVQQTIKLLKKFTLPGFDQIPVFKVVKFIFEEIRKDQIPTRARSIAYSFFIAFFPGLIFLLTLLPYIPLEGFQAEFIFTTSERWTFS